MFTWAWRLGCGLVTLVAVAAIAAAVVVPRLAGATPYTVLTSSMRPGLPPGTLVVVRPVHAAEIGVGSVITYQLESGKATMVTHRVVAQGFGADGEVVLQTQGDANDVPDEAWVLPDQLRGEKWYAVPYLGYASHLLTGQERRMSIYVVAVLLVGYALSMFVGAWRGRRRSAPFELTLVPREEMADRG